MILSNTHFIASSDKKQSKKAFFALSMCHSGAEYARGKNFQGFFTWACSFAWSPMRETWAGTTQGWGTKIYDNFL